MQSFNLAKRWLQQSAKRVESASSKEQASSVKVFDAANIGSASNNSVAKSGCDSRALSLLSNNMIRLSSLVKQSSNKRILVNDGDFIKSENNSAFR